MGPESTEHSGSPVSRNVKRRLMTVGGALLLSVAGVVSGTSATTHAASGASVSLNNAVAASTTSNNSFVSLSGAGTSGTYSMSTSASGAATAFGTWTGSLGGVYWYTHKGSSYAPASCGSANYVQVQYYLDIPGAFSLSTLTVGYDLTKGQGTYSLSSSIGNFATSKPTSSVQVSAAC
ncbi:MAG TPA: hypothetical protein VF221_08380 [Chloroflexota bacterium]